MAKGSLQFPLQNIKMTTKSNDTELNHHPYSETSSCWELTTVLKRGRCSKPMLSSACWISMSFCWCFWRSKGLKELLLWPCETPPFPSGVTLNWDSWDSPFWQQAWDQKIVKKANMDCPSRGVWGHAPPPHHPPKVSDAKSCNLGQYWGQKVHI